MVTETKTKEITVVIVEDFKLTRVGLRCALNENEDIRVVAESDNAIEGLELIRKYRPNVVLMDLGLSGMNGIEAIMKIVEMDSNIKSIALTSHDREEEVIATLVAGATGYCLKDIDNLQARILIGKYINEEPCDVLAQSREGLVVVSHQWVLLAAVRHQVVALQQRLVVF